MLSLLSVNILVFSPLAASLIIASPLFGANNIYIRRFAKTFATIHFLYTLLFVYFHHFGVVSFYNEITFFDKPWLNQLGINASFGLDGFTLLLSVLTSFVFLISFVISKTMIRTKHKMYYSLMFLLFTTVLGMFCSKDMFLFLMFWEAELVPAYFLISEWGTGDCKKSAMKYVLYLFLGSIFISIAMFGLYYYGYYSNGELSAYIDFLRIYPSEDICPLFLQKLMFWLFFAGFAMKIPVVPFHSCVSEALSDSATPVSILLAGILLKTGAYGLIRFNLYLFPQIFTEYAPIIAIFAVLSIIWAGCTACRQADIKKIALFFYISCSGLFLLGLSSVNKAGFDGSFMFLTANTFSIIGLFLVVGLIHQAAKTKTLQEIVGLGKTMPILMIISYLIIFSCLAVPFTANFPAEILIFSGAFSTDFGENILNKILVLTAVFSLILLCSCLFKLFHGMFCKTDYLKKKYNDVSGHRFLMLFIICFCILLFGIFPDSIMNIYNDFTNNLITILQV